MKVKIILWPPMVLGTERRQLTPLGFASIKERTGPQPEEEGGKDAYRLPWTEGGRVTCSCLRPADKITAEQPPLRRMSIKKAP